ncbi:MAG: hypothetical protein V1726_05535 [Methanobacteriota archaeon]
MIKQKIPNRGIVLGLIVLFIGAAIIPSTIAQRNVPDPILSIVELTGQNLPGLVTCPAGDGSIYNYLKVTVKDSNGNPIPSLPANVFEFIVTSAGASWHGTLSCTFTAIDTQTNANGEIRFSIRGDTSITGNINIQVIVIGLIINNAATLTCKTMDYNLDGQVSLGDFTVFGQDYTTTAWRSDFNFDGQVSLADFTVFGQHFTHS